MHRGTINLKKTMFGLRISVKLTLWYLIATGVIIGAMSILVYKTFDRQRRDAIDADLLEYAEFLISGMGDEVYDLSEMFDRMQKRKSKPSAKPKPHRFVLASNDSLIFEANTLINLDSLLSSLQEKRKHESFYFATVKLNNTEYRTYSRNIQTPQKRQFQLTVITSLDRVYESLEQLQYLLFMFSPGALLLAGVIGYLIARRALSPVKQITATAESITFQSLDKRVPLGKSHDELYRLAKTFNEMIQRLDDLFNTQQRFIADASHDLRTPLTILQIELEMLCSRKDLEADVKLTVEKCLKESHRLSRLADSLLLLARADSNQLQPNPKLIRLDELASESLIQFNNLAIGKKVTFRMNVNEPVMIKADENLLRRVIINIIDNAVKYSNENSIITISADCSDKLAVLSVHNTGKPIPEELLPRVFDRFQRGERSRSTDGFGLGLSIAKAILEAHGGSISAESNKETGTTFIMNIPTNYQI